MTVQLWYTIRHWIHSDPAKAEQWNADSLSQRQIRCHGPHHSGQDIHWHLADTWFFLWSCFGMKYISCLRATFVFTAQCTSLSTNPKVKELLKSVHICHSCRNKKLSYRRETSRQLPTWKRLSPPVHSLSPLWLHLCVRSNAKPATNVHVRQACCP